MQHFKKLENGTYQVIGYHAESAMGWKEEQRVTEISKHSSIKEAEKYLRWLEAIK